MDRLTQLRGEAGGSRDSTLDTSAAPSEAYLTANESSKYFSLTEEDSSFDLSPIKDISLASAAPAEKGTDQLLSDLSPTSKKGDLLDSYKFTKQIEAANILSGGVDIFDDNDNSYDGDELVIDDNADMDEKSNSEHKLESAEPLDHESDVGRKDYEVILQIDGNNLHAIDIGNGLYLYRKAGEEELAAVQIVADDNDQPSFKFLKVRENNEGNLEVYEEIEIEVPKEVPAKDESTTVKKSSHLPVKDIKQAKIESNSNKVPESNRSKILPCPSKSEIEDPKLTSPEIKSDANLNGKMMKNETRKSPVIHSTPNKEGIPLTKTMVDLQLQPNRQLDKVKTIEVHTDNKQKLSDNQIKKYIPDESQLDLVQNTTEKNDKPSEILNIKEIANVKTSETIQAGSSETSFVQNQDKSPSKYSSQLPKEIVSVKTLKSSDADLETEQKNTASVKNILENTVSDDTPAAIISDKTDATLSEQPESLTKFNTSKDKPSDKTLINKSKTMEPENIDQQKTNDASKTETQEKNDGLKAVDTVKTSTIDSVKEKQTLPNKKETSEISCAKKEALEPENIDHQSGKNNTVALTVERQEKGDKLQTDEKHIPSTIDSVKETQTLLKKQETTKISCANKEAIAPGKNISDASEDNSSMAFSNKETILEAISINQSCHIKEESKVMMSEIIPTEEMIATPKTSEETKLLSKDNKLKVKDTQIDDTNLMMMPKVSSDNFTCTDVKNNSSVKKSEDSSKNAKKDGTVMTISSSIYSPRDNKNEIKLVETASHDLKLHEVKTTLSPVLVDRNVSMCQSKQTKEAQSNLPNIAPGDLKPVLNLQDQIKTPTTLTTDTLNKQNVEKKPIPSETNKFVTQGLPVCLKSVPVKEDNKKINILKVETVRAQPGVQKFDPVNKTYSRVELQKKPEPRSISVNKATFVKKPVNNNNDGVPFGKWTEAHRQDFLNRIKETKVPVSTSNTKQIKQANDLNRRDVLQKIDSQRQSNIASIKNQELAKLSVKNEPTFISKSMTTNTSVSFRESQPAKTEISKNQTILPKKSEVESAKAITYTTYSHSVAVTSTTIKPEGSNRKEINNQDLIDKTIEGIINRVVSVKPQDNKTNPDPKDTFEMKMNELHGIPFVERPPHELPKVYNRDPKKYSKLENPHMPSGNISKIPNKSSLCTTAQLKNLNEKDAVIDLDSEEEVIEHEPVTGDIDLYKKNSTTIKTHSVPVSNAAINTGKTTINLNKKESIITENEFDKFYRRNSLSYEDNYTNKRPTQIVTADIGKDKLSAFKPTHTLPDAITKLSKPKSSYGQMQPNKIQMTSKLVPVDDSILNKHYQSKLQQAYQTALTTKRKMESPITIIEDKPVKVVFMDSSTEYSPTKLNVQGQQLSPNKKPDPVKLTDSVSTRTGDTLDHEILDSFDGARIPEEPRVKTKHQRKQVLTPVETPELELIVPSDLGIQVSPKKKRKAEELNKMDTNTKNVVPKKSYLLGRNVTADEIGHRETQNLTKEATEEPDTGKVIMTHNDTASAIDNLVKAAELLETQSASFNVDVSNIANVESPQSASTPPKRGRGRPRKHPLPEGVTPSPDRSQLQSPHKRSRLIDAKQKKRSSLSDESTTSDDEMLKENWTMGKINENIVCPICNKLFRSENVVFKHVKHCTGPSPNRSESDKQSRRRSIISNDSRSVDSKFDDTDGDSDKPLSKKSTPRKRRSKELSVDRNDEIGTKKTNEKPVETKQEIRKPMKTKAQYKVSSLSCEYCGKTFRQLSYLVNHRLIHKKTNPRQLENEKPTIDKTVFSCEVCRKEFRKLHHLVQHRIIHNPSSSRPSRKSSAEHTKDQMKQNDQDQSAGFRCEPCDKSFRKLHHLVEHRETHDGINRQKNISSTPDKVLDELPPQCDVCKKTFRKLHHLIEHKEQHLETSSDKSDDKSVKSSLSTRDIIHECSLCYMVFPNENSLTKHSVICLRKRRQSALKQAKQAEEAEKLKGTENPSELEIITLDETETSCPAVESENTENADAEPKDIKIVEDTLAAEEKRISNEQKAEPIVPTPPTKPIEEKIPEVDKSNNVTNTDKSEVIKIRKPDVKSEKEAKYIEASKKRTPVKESQEAAVETPELKGIETSKKRTPVKYIQGSTVEKRRRSNLPLSNIKETSGAESSDEDDIRYMFNPDYKEPKKPATETSTSEGKMFMSVRAKKRNSLQFERPKSKETAKRRTSLQNPPKIQRVKSAGGEKNETPANTAKSPKLEPVTATDSDDSDIKYSFPEKAPKADESEKADIVSKPQTPKQKRKSIVDKRKALSGIAKRKSLGRPATLKPKEKTPPAPAVKEVKRRSAAAEHRCDCGQLFFSAALLARHASLAHTPPRVRRRRTASPPAAPAPPASAKPAIEAPAPRAKPGRPPGKSTPPVRNVPPPSTATKTRRTPAHRGVPVPEKMRKLMEKLKK